MRFTTDQDVYAGTVRLLRESGHDVHTATDLGLAQADDAQLLRTSHLEGRVFVTRDRDFGNLVHVQGLKGGVVYLRMMPSTIGAVHTELQRVLTRYTEEDLLRAFVVVEPGRHRIRKLSGG